MNKRDYIFIIIIVLIILIGDFTLIREQKNISKRENRELQQFEHFTLKSYLNGSYQNNLESAMSDQFIASETIKIKLKAALKFFDYKVIPKSICSNKYVSLDGSYCNFNCDNSILLHYEQTNNEFESSVIERINNYNTINKHIDTYYYFISTPQIFDFENNKYSIDLINLLEENLKGEKGFSALEFEDYTEYKKYFYKTDHHWNYFGSYEGYKDIISMINKKSKVLKPTGETIFNDNIFYGSAARITQIFDFKENFKVYEYNFPSMEILTNRSIEGYGAYDDYVENDYSNDKFTNYYAIYYGDDYAEVRFDTDKGKENLLIIGNSYTNSVNKLIATHFNKTYDVDLRHYDYTFNEEFNIKKYVEDNDIDKVLIIMDYGLLTNDNFDIEWGE